MEVPLKIPRADFWVRSKKSFSRKNNNKRVVKPKASAAQAEIKAPQKLTEKECASGDLLWYSPCP